MEINKISSKKATLNYFQKPIEDERHGFCSKVEGAQLMYSNLGDKLDEVDFQMWLVDALRLKDRNDLIMILGYSVEESSAITPKLFSIITLLKSLIKIY